MAAAKQDASNGKSQESTRDEARRRKEEAAAKVRAAQIESGDLIVGDEFEFAAAERDTKSSERVEALVRAVKSSKTPVVFADACETLGIKYAEDYMPAMIALEKAGLVRRFEARSAETTAPKAAFLWIG